MTKNVGEIRVFDMGSAYPMEGKSGDLVKSKSKKLLFKFNF